MGLFHSPSIVRDGLVLCLDAANPKSYTGSGTTWYDLSGNSKNGALTNGPTYNLLNNGGIVFDGSDDYILTSNCYTGNSLPIGNSPRTLISIFKTPTSLSGYQHIMHYGAQVGDQSFGIALYNGIYFSNHTWGGNSYCSNITATPSTIYFVAITYSELDSPRNKFFINGNFGNVSYGQGKSADYTINTGSTYQMNIGTRIGPMEYLGNSGVVYLVNVYNRALSAAEILQNFHATRGRYSL